MHRLLWLFVSVFAISIIAETANAATIKRGIFDSGREYLYLNGRIVKGDAAQIQDLLDTYHGIDRIYMNSNGGNWKEGKEIGKVIKRNNLLTLIATDHKCASACAIAFTHGRAMVMRPSSKLGFHFSYYSENTLNRIKDEHGIKFVQKLIKYSMKKDIQYFLSLPIISPTKFLDNVLEYGNEPQDMWYPSQWELKNIIGVDIISKKR